MLDGYFACPCTVKVLRKHIIQSRCLYPDPEIMNYEWKMSLPLITGLHAISGPYSPLIYTPTDLLVWHQMSSNILEYLQMSMKFCVIFVKHSFSNWQRIIVQYLDESIDTTLISRLQEVTVPTQNIILHMTDGKITSHTFILFYLWCVCFRNDGTWILLLLDGAKLAVSTASILYAKQS